jgi:hypothetical protein
VFPTGDITVNSSAGLAHSVGTEKATSAGLDRRSFDILEVSENLLAESPHERGPAQKAKAEQEQRAWLGNVNQLILITP